MATYQEASDLESGRALHIAGRLDDAETVYRRVLATDPSNVDALHLLGILLNQAGQFELSVEMMQQAVRGRPSDPALRNDLGNALKDAGRLADAEKSYRQVLKQRPDYADAHSNLAALLHAKGRFAEAEKSARRALALDGKHPQAWNHLGIALSAQSKFEEGVAAFRRAIELDENFTEAYDNLGKALAAVGSLHEAMRSHERAAKMKPDFASAHTNLGHVLMMLGRSNDALWAFGRALALKPTAAQACDFGNALMEAGRAEEAAERHFQALTLEPGSAMFHHNHGVALLKLGDLENAESRIRRAIGLDADALLPHSALAFLLNHMPGRSAAEIFTQHREFGRRFKQDQMIRRSQPHSHTGRKIRIGYMSGDLRDHPVAVFAEPVFAHHNRQEFEVFCYHNFARSDGTTERLKSHVDVWRDIYWRSDDAVADLIGSDGIDILIDLSGHTTHHRLLVFARKPAPVQATWLGYLNTTGLDAMDWRITDERACPTGLLDDFHTEKLMRLPDGQWCYLPPKEAPRVSVAPILQAGHCTFGSFCTLSKINRQVMESWAQLLESVPGSHLLIGTTVATIPAAFLERLRASGIDINRVDVRPSKPFNDYLASHASLDVMLDTFPYTGGTTTCHSLWMGVPIVSLAGDTATSRGGASLLHTVGLPELVATTREQYVQIAAALAQDVDRLVALRASLRERVRNSPLVDAVRFTAHLEDAYRAMWQRALESTS